MRAIRTEFGIKLKRDDWKEWFRLEFEEGIMRPKFFLPTYRLLDRRTIMFWVFPLAPFVLVWHIIAGAFWSIWKDLIEWGTLISKTK